MFSDSETVVLARKGSEEDWVKKRLPELATANKKIKLSFGNHFAFAQESGISPVVDGGKEQVAGARTEKIGLDIECEAAAKSERRDRYALPRILERTACDIGHLLTRFRIGDEELGYPDRLVSSAQWCSFFVSCPKLEDVKLVSCLNADDAVLDALKNHKNLRELHVTGSHKSSGSVTKNVIGKLCARVVRGDGATPSKVLKNVPGTAKRRSNKTEGSKERPQPDTGAAPGTAPLQNHAVGEVYFPMLEYLVLTNQSDILEDSFERMKKERPDIHFRCGLARGNMVITSMLGVRHDVYADTNPPDIKSAVGRSNNEFYDDYYADGF